jgi:glycosyltransferase involved in cell wall biosynthesis
MGLKIAILGTRGVPNNYGGFEHIAGHLSRGLVQKGHEVTVYNSSKHPYRKNQWHGVHIRHCFDPEFLIGTVGQFLYDLNCILDARKRNYDIILMLGYTSSSIWGSLYPKDAIIITNMDGMEWKRSKYAKPVKKFLRFAEKLAVQSSRFHIADSTVIKEYLDKKYNINSKYIAYGAGLYPVADENILNEYGLYKYQYFLLMARMEPENNIEMILDGYTLTNSKTRFVVIGNTSSRFGKSLIEKYRNDSRIVFLGALFNEIKVQTLTTFCKLYFHGHSVGGTNPSLLDAMAAKAPIAVHNNVFNNSVVKGNALQFKSPTDVFNLINANHYSNESFIRNNYATIADDYTWEKIVNQYEYYFLTCYLNNQSYYPLKPATSATN